MGGTTVILRTAVATWLNIGRRGTSGNLSGGGGGAAMASGVTGGVEVGGVLSLSLSLSRPALPASA